MVHVLNLACASRKGFPKHLTEITALGFTIPGGVEGTVLLLQKRNTPPEEV